MSYTTHTEELGRCHFTAPHATDTRDGYVWVETEHGYASRERRQICYGGDFRGSTITAREGELKAAAQKWLRQRRAYLRSENLV